MNPQNKKYVQVSQSWTNLRYVKTIEKTFNPISDQGKNKLTSLQDLQTIIEFFDWGDEGIYYKFKDSKTADWGCEVYEIGDHGSLSLVNSNYDSSD